MTLGLNRRSPTEQPSQRGLTLSRPAVFYTTSLTVAGCFLALMAIGGYYVELYGGSWGTVVQILVLFLALLSVAAFLYRRQHARA